MNIPADLRMNSKDGELRLQESRIQSGEAAGTLQDQQRDGVVQLRRSYM